MSFGLILLIAAVQGLTEFLPVSSSGHLVLIPIIIEISYQGQVIDVAAHVGTLIAVFIYLRHDVIIIFKSIIGYRCTPEMRSNRRLGLMILLSTLPIITIGFMLNYANWHWLTLVTTLAWANLIFAALLWVSDRCIDKINGLKNIRWSAAIGIGLMQIFALVPGVSRSGVTMTAARFYGYDRTTAARFSLLLSLPVITGAGTLKTIDLVKFGSFQLGIDVILVIIFSAIFAWMAIRFMMSWLKTASFTVFVIYRLVLGIILLLALNKGWILSGISPIS